MTEYNIKITAHPNLLWLSEIVKKYKIKHKIIIKILKQFTQTEDMRHLMVNKYPYHYARGITNWVLWFEKEDATREEMIRWVEGYEELDDYDLIVYENPPSYKSVKGIRHLQILARETEDGQRRQIYFHSNNE